MEQEETDLCPWGRGIFCYKHNLAHPDKDRGDPCTKAAAVTPMHLVELSTQELSAAFGSLATDPCNVPRVPSTTSTRDRGSLP